MNCGTRIIDSPCSSMTLVQLQVKTLSSVIFDDDVTCLWYNQLHHQHSLNDPIVKFKIGRYSHNILYMFPEWRVQCDWIFLFVIIKTSINNSFLCLCIHFRPETSFKSSLQLHLLIYQIYTKYLLPQERRVRTNESESWKYETPRSGEIEKN